MKKSVLIATAVTAALGGGIQSAHALNGPASLAAQVKLVVSGASAQRDNFRLRMLTTLCQAGTFDTWLMTDGVSATSEDFRAYSCTLNGTNGTTAGQTALVYYRSEGGSVYGVGPMLASNPKFGTGVKRLVLSDDTTGGICASFNTAGVNHNCVIAASSYNLATDATTTAGALIDDVTDVGVSDVEPSQFIAPNWPTATVLGTTAPTKAQLAALDLQASVANGTVFAVMISETITGGAGGTADFGVSISREQLQQIFSRSVSDWGKVINQNTGAAVGTAGTAIRLCRRERGSGTQASAAAYFLQTNCTNQYTLSMPDGNGVDVIDNNSGGVMNACVATANSIGFASFSAAGTGTNWIQIDKVSPSVQNGASGLYGFTTEVTIQKRVGLPAAENTLADAIISQSKLTSSYTGSLSAFGLPSGGNTASIANAAATPPTATGDRGKKTCSPRGSAL